MPPLPAEFQKSLLSWHVSRPNKLWLISGWERQYAFQWRWAGKEMQSRMMFCFDGKNWKKAKSFEEDFWPTLVWM